ncbi:MAG: DUF3185 family protein [Xanthomonadales bacterium]|nr:DUF3185 family protein [Xanthomonadales bacterium]
MSNKKIIGLVCLIVGIALLYFGYNASQSVTETVSETLTGRYTDETMIMLIGGAVAAVVGLVLFLKR